MNQDSHNGRYVGPVTVSSRQNAHLTFKANRGLGRHGWLRLTPAYSLRLVREHVADLPPGSVVTDPFSGTGTTALAAAEHGVCGQAFDINPFLIWLGRAKTQEYGQLETLTALAPQVAAQARSLLGSPDLWQPRLANIERWWSPSALTGLKALRAALDARRPDVGGDLLDIAFCRALIKASNAAFNHQSMSFKAPGQPTNAAEAVLESFVREASDLCASTADNLPGQAVFVRSDSRSIDAAAVVPCDLLLTSPPYVNRMSYIRELRPYMYWLRYLDKAHEAADLDWTAIGGTWGTATSRLATWQPEQQTPIAGPLDALCDRICADGGKSGFILSNYVHKYFADMWPHFQSAYKHVKSGGLATYIVGNSAFYGHIVPVEEWYRLLLLEAGFDPVQVTVIRKRSSKKELLEFAVTARRP
jgi:hypothetical protein